MKGNGIVRVRKRSSPYAMIDKRYLSDRRLSYKAKGVLTYLLSKPDDWKVMFSDLVNQSTDGPAAVRSGMRELATFGYLLRVRVADRRSGRFLRWEYQVFEVPDLAATAQERQPTLFETFDTPAAVPTSPGRAAPKPARQHKSVPRDDDRDEAPGETPAPSSVADLPGETPASAPEQPGKPRFSQIPPDCGFPHVGEPQVEKPQVGNRTLLKNERTKNELTKNDERGGRPPPLVRDGGISLAASDGAGDPCAFDDADAVLALVQDPAEFRPDDARRLVAKRGAEQVRVAIANADILQRRGKLRRRRQYIATAINERYDPIPDDGKPAAGPTPEAMAEAARVRAAQAQAEREQLDAQRRDDDRVLATLSEAQWAEHVAAIRDSLPAKSKQDLARGVHPRDQALVRWTVLSRLRSTAASAAQF